MVSAGDVGGSNPATFEVATLDPEIVAQRTGELIERTTWSRERLLSYQSDRLREILRHAAANSPFYRERIGELVARAAPLVEFPVMNKTILMANFDRIVTDPRLSRSLVEEHVGSDRAGLLLLDEYRVAATGGTSGVRGIFVYDQDAWTVTVANMRRMQGQLGLPQGVRYLGIGAPSPIHLSNRFYAEGRVGRRDAPRLSVTTPMDEVVAALNAYQPEILSTYPSFMRRLAEEQTSGRLHISPSAMRSVAEALSPDVRDLVRATWSIEVTNNYAATEVGIIGMECKHVCGIHLAEDLLIVEVVDEANQPVGPGIQGAKVLITTLFNRTLPLIRYELTDLVAAIPGPCPCGSPFRRIGDIQGRREEMLHVWTSGGKQVEVHAARLWFHLVRVPGIRQYQFAQLPKGIKVLIAVYPDHDSDRVRQAAAQIARAALNDLGATGGLVEVEIVDKIERVGTGAKQRLVQGERSGG